MDQTTMLGKLVFGIATLFFGASLFTATVAFGDGSTVPGFQAFFSAIKYGTAGLFSAESMSSVVTHFLALVAAAANFIFIFWAMLVFSPTKVTSFKWFWWISLLFLLAAAYIGVLIVLDDRTTLKAGYYFWLTALFLMLLAPVLSRVERKRALKLARQTRSLQGRALNQNL